MSPRDRAQEHLLVIAHQEAGVHSRRRRRHQPLDDAARIGAPVDEVAEEDISGARAAAPGAVVGGDAREQSVEQIEPAVNVADRIDADPVRHLVGARLHPGGEVEQGLQGHGFYMGGPGGSEVGR